MDLDMFTRGKGDTAKNPVTMSKDAVFDYLAQSVAPVLQSSLEYL